MPPPSQWRPSTALPHTAGSVTRSSQASNEHPGRPPSRITPPKPPGPNSYLLKCSSERLSLIHI
eukprot:10449509-Prorocentrum_lima.AAC.1